MDSERDEVECERTGEKKKTHSETERASLSDVGKKEKSKGKP